LHNSNVFGYKLKNMKRLNSIKRSFAPSISTGGVLKQILKSGCQRVCISKKKYDALIGRQVGYLSKPALN
jgi:hypothetical protein